MAICMVTAYPEMPLSFTSGTKSFLVKNENFSDQIVENISKFDGFPKVSGSGPDFPCGHTGPVWDQHWSISLGLPHGYTLGMCPGFLDKAHSLEKRQRLLRLSSHKHSTKLVIALVIRLVHDLHKVPLCSTLGTKSFWLKYCIGRPNSFKTPKTQRNSYFFDCVPPFPDEWTYR